MIRGGYHPGEDTIYRQAGRRYENYSAHEYLCIAVRRPHQPCIRVPCSIHATAGALDLDKIADMRAYTGWIVRLRKELQADGGWRRRRTLRDGWRRQWLASMRRRST